MQRIAVAPREDWPERAAELGFAFHTIDGQPYWTETAAYALSAAEVDALEDAAQALEDICLDFVGETIERGDYEGFGLSDAAIALVEDSWNRQDKNLYGRFDLAFGADGAPKLLEYNADTPTALFEASVVQWEWLEHHFPQRDQFNSIHETLVEAWQHFGLYGHRLHFACVRNHAEDEGTVDYLRDTAMQAGVDAERLYMDEIGWNGRRFVDMANQPITMLFKLYPWEWLMAEDFAAHIGPSGIRMIEPAWKMLLSTKALLPRLWARHAGHPNLLPASFAPGDIEGAMVRKPLLGREGAGVALFDAQGREILSAAPNTATGSADGAAAFVYQQAVELQSFDGHYPMLGAWLVASRACGLGIREDDTAITRNSSRFVPHFFQ